MKPQGYPKDKLTIQNIRSDLRKKLWQSWLMLALFVLTFVSLLYLVIANPAFLFHAGGRWRVPNWVYVLIYPFVIGFCISAVVRVCSGLRLDGRIVKDCLISAESDSHVSVHIYHNRDSCTLRFARYGDYHVPQKNHTWSKLYPLSCMGEYYHASEGDEYYLVLSRPHNGKILLAYNAKLFELETETSTEK